MKRPIDGADLAGKLRTRKANAVGHPEVMDAYEMAMNDAIDAEEITLNALRDEVYQDAVKHGLWLDTDGPMRCVSLIDGELRELSEEAGNVLDVRSDGGDETEVWAAYCDELADVIITCFSAAGKLGIDIDAAVKHKMEINKTRPWKHGKE